MGKTGIITKEDKGGDNEYYHEIISLFNIYRSDNWKMQLKINQFKKCFNEEYGTNIEEFRECIYQAGIDITLDSGYY